MVAVEAGPGSTIEFMDDFKEINAVNNRSGAIRSPGVLKRHHRFYFREPLARKGFDSRPLGTRLLRCRPRGRFGIR